jgi:hypothetical protein
MSSGIVLLAVGNEHFRNLATNFAISAKVQSPNIPISLITTQKNAERLNGLHRPLYDQIIYIDPETYHINGQPDYGLAKLRIYEHAPYEENLFVDADSLMSMYGTIERVFDVCRPFKFYILNNNNVPTDSNAGISIWGNVDRFKELGLKAPVGTGLQSSMIYFNKCAGGIGEKIFANALKTHAFIKAGKAEASNVWYNSVPDELCFSIGSSMSNFTHQVSWFDLAVMRGSGGNDTMINHEATHRACQIITFPSGLGNVTRATLNFYNGVIYHFARTGKIRYATDWIDKNRIQKTQEITRITTNRR